MKLNGKLKTIISVSTIAIMLLSTMGIGVFAAEDTGAGTAEPGQVETQEPTDVIDGEDVIVDDEASEVEGEDAVAEETPIGADDENQDNPLQAGTPLDKPVTGLKTLSGHQQIKLSWKALTNETITTGEGDAAVTEPIDVTSYQIWRKPKSSLAKSDEKYTLYATINLAADGTPSVTGNATKDSYKTFEFVKKNHPAIGTVKNSEGKITNYYFEDRDVGDGMVDNHKQDMRGGVFYYKVVPVAEKDGQTYEYGLDESDSVHDNCMQTSYVILKLKINKKLTSHDKKHKTRSFPKGTKIWTCAFGYGKFCFFYDDNFYWLNRIGTGSHVSKYNRNTSYSKAEAEYFVNGRYTGKANAKSKTKKLVWVNTYTQRIYVFKKKGKKWVLFNAKNGWRVSTGKGATLTIRYIDPKNDNLDTGRIVGKYKTINKKVRSRHSIPYWNCFSTWNAIHGQKSFWSIKSIPKSNGCVRNTNAHAKFIYTKCPKKTRVLIF